MNYIVTASATNQKGNMFPWRKKFTAASGAQAKRQARAFLTQKGYDAAAMTVKPWEGSAASSRTVRATQPQTYAEKGFKTYRTLAGLQRIKVNDEWYYRQADIVGLFQH